MESQEGTRNGTSGGEGQQQQCLVCEIEVPPNGIASEDSQDKSLINDCAHLFFNKEDLEVFQRDLSGAQALVVLCGECKPRLTDVKKGFTEGLILIEERVKEAFGNLMKEVNDLKVAAEWTEARLTRIFNSKRAETVLTVKTEAGDTAGHFRKGIVKAKKRLSLLQKSLKSGKLVLDGFKLNYISNEVTPVVQEHDETDAVAAPDDSGNALLRKEPVVVLTRLPPETVLLAMKSPGSARSFQTGDATTAQENKTPNKSSTLGTGTSTAPPRSSKELASKDGNSSSDKESSEDEDSASSISSPGSASPQSSSSAGLAAAASDSKRKISQPRSYRNRKSTYFFKRSGMFHCKRCDKSSKVAATIQHHFNSVHLKKRYKCDICNVGVYTSTWDLSRHRKTCRQNLEKLLAKEKDPRFKFVCEECGKRFDKNAGLYGHRKQVHINADRFPCDLCDKKFKRADCLQNHRNVVHFRKYFCRFCKKVSRSRPLNITHESSCKKNNTK